MSRVIKNLKYLGLNSTERIQLPKILKNIQNHNLIVIDREYCIFCYFLDNPGKREMYYFKKRIIYMKEDSFICEDDIRIGLCRSFPTRKNSTKTNQKSPRNMASNTKQRTTGRIEYGVSSNKIPELMGLYVDVSTISNMKLIEENKIEEEEDEKTLNFTLLKTKESFQVDYSVCKKIPFFNKIIEIEQCGKMKVEKENITLEDPILKDELTDQTIILTNEELSMRHINHAIELVNQFEKNYLHRCYYFWTPERERDQKLITMIFLKNRVIIFADLQVFLHYDSALPSRNYCLFFLNVIPTAFGVETKQGNMAVTKSVCKFLTGYIKEHSFGRNNFICGIEQVISKSLIERKRRESVNDMNKLYDLDIQMMKERINNLERQVEELLKERKLKEISSI